MIALHLWSPCARALVAWSLVAPGSRAPVAQRVDVAAPLDATRDATDAQRRIAVAPVAVSGDLIAARREEASRRVLDALARSEHEVVALGADVDACAEDRCRIDAAGALGATWLVVPSLEVEAGARDYAVKLVVFDVGSGKPLAESSGSCDLCGFEDAMGTLEAETADLLATLDRVVTIQPGTLRVATAPAGATLSIDGKDVGPAPYSGKLAPGRHRIVATLAGYTAQSVDLEVIEGVDKAIDIQLVRVPTAPMARGSGLVISGSIVTGLGVLSTIAGGVLLGIDQAPYRRECQADADGDCRYIRDTFEGGVTLASAGAAVVITGAVLLGIGLGRRARARRVEKVALLPFALGARF